MFSFEFVGQTELKRTRHSAVSQTSSQTEDKDHGSLYLLLEEKEAETYDLIECIPNVEVSSMST